MSKSPYRSIGGGDIHILLSFNDNIWGANTPYIYLGSAISVSYSVYRNKIPVYNVGETLVSGFAIGQKTVAGSIVKAVMEEDEISEFMTEKVKWAKENKIIDSLSKISYSKSSGSIMKDDLMPFDMILLFSSEYTGEASAEIIYGCNIINNGQIVSAMDMFTETTISFVARNIKQLHDIVDNSSFFNKEDTYIKSASSLFKKEKIVNV